MKRSELVRQLNLLPDVEVKILFDHPHTQGYLVTPTLNEVYFSNSDEIVLNQGYDTDGCKEYDKPKSNKFE